MGKVSGLECRPLCRHCKIKYQNRPRGLCWTCERIPGVRELYPSTSKYARRGSGNKAGASLPTTDATDAPPGSEAKILILMARAERGESLFGDDDTGVIVHEPVAQKSGIHRVCVPALRKHLQD